jgi:hypothetical protein
VKVIKILHHEDIENIIDPTGLLDSSDEGKDNAV